MWSSVDYLYDVVPVAQLVAHCTNNAMVMGLKSTEVYIMIKCIPCNAL